MTRKAIKRAAGQVLLLIILAPGSLVLSLAAMSHMVR